MRIAIPFLLLLLVGCSKIEMAKMRRRTDADVIRFVRQYKEAGIADVEGVLKEYLALANGYERLGGARYGAPGWIDEVRSVCEARLAVFYKAVGKDAAYQEHVSRAIAYRKRANPNSDSTAADLCGFVERLDAGNIQPRWRSEVAELKTPSSNRTTK